MCDGMEKVWLFFEYFQQKMRRDYLIVFHLSKSAPIGDNTKFAGLFDFFQVYTGLFGRVFVMIATCVAELHKLICEGGG